MMKKLKRMLEPRTIAVVGVSLSNHMNPANVIYNKNHLRYRARAFCVNPRGGELYGEKVFKKISEIPEKIDLAVLSVRAEFVPEILEESIDSGVSGAIIISGGFSETGRSDLSERIVRIAERSKFPFIGPNCIGVYSPPYADTFFLSYERLIEPRPGGVALVSQSGGILVDQMIKLTQENVGLSLAISIGNKAVIDEIDLLKFLDGDERTSMIGLYIEGFRRGRGRDFVRALERIRKPVVVLKSGKTPGGSRAVSSHTASIAGDHAVFSEVVRASKAIEAENEKAFLSYCESLSAFQDKRVKNVCIITASGGHGAIASDDCYTSGLNTPEIPAADQAELRSRLSPSIQNITSLSNPIDMTGSAVDDDFIAAVRFFLDKEYVDCVILLLLPYLPGITSDIGARISQYVREHPKPVVVYMPRVDKYGIFIEGFEVNQIPVAHSVDAAVYMAKSLGDGR